MATAPSLPRPSKPAQRRRWLQFRLRSLLALMLVAAMLMGAWRWQLRSYERQQAAREKISRLTTTVETEPGQPAWLRPLFGSEVFQDVTHVVFDGRSRLSDDDLAPLADFPRLKRLSLDGTALTDKGLAHLAGLKELETLSLNNTRVTSAGLVHLRGLNHLKHLELGNTKIDGAGLAQLSGHKKLEFLELRDLPIGDKHLAALERLAELRQLDLSYTRIVGPGLSHLSGMRNLTRLCVSGDHLKSIDLRGMQSLHDVYLDAGVEGRMTCTIHDCPRLDRLDVLGDFETFDLRNVPYLLELRYESPHDSQPRKLTDLSVTLRSASGLHFLSIGRVGRLTLDFEGSPALEWVRLVPQSFAETRIRGVPWLENIVLSDEALADSRTKDGCLYFHSARPLPTGPD